MTPSTAVPYFKLSRGPIIQNEWEHLGGFAGQKMNKTQMGRCTVSVKSFQFLLFPCAEAFSIHCILETIISIRHVHDGVPIVSHYRGIHHVLPAWCKDITMNQRYENTRMSLHPYPRAEALKIDSPFLWISLKVIVKYHKSISILCYFILLLYYILEANILLPTPLHVFDHLVDYILY